MGRLDGKVAVITGAGGGIGKQLLFAAEGARVVVNDIGAHSGADAASVVSEIEEAGGLAVADTNSATWDGAEAVVGTAIDRFGGIDIVVNNATANGVDDIWRLTEEQWDRALNANRADGRLVVHRRRQQGERPDVPRVRRHVLAAVRTGPGAQHVPR